MSKKKVIVAFVFLCIAVVFLLIEIPKRKQYVEEQGLVFGTIYHITYENVDGKSLQLEVDSLLCEVDASLSMFNPQSVIARINRNDSSVVLDTFFTMVYTKALEVSEASEGAFDITVAPLVNVWGFGSEKQREVSQNVIDSLLPFIGYTKIKLEDGKIVKDDSQIMLDASAIAKGFACDVVAKYFDQCGIDNYMVEIGGEVALKGVNSAGKAWRVGINKPMDDSTQVKNEIQEVVKMQSGGMATSGNYRNFYMRDGKKYAHIINPKTGFPVNHNLLSATIIAEDCMTADAFATACMVLGLEGSLRLCETHSNLAGFFIYDDNGVYKTAFSANFQSYLIKK